MTRALTTLLSFFVATTAALHAQVVDQQQTAGTGCLLGLWNEDLAQSFKPTTTVCVGGGFLIATDLAPDEVVTISLWDEIPSFFGTPLATGTAVASSGGWVDVFWAGVPVTPGAEYFLQLDGSTNVQCVTGLTSDPYDRGQAYGLPGFVPFPQWDYAFRTFTEGSPTLQVLDVQPGAFMTIDISGLSVGSQAVTLVTTMGSGPTSSPFGALQVSQPWLQTPPFPEDGSGKVQFTTTLPASLSGQTLDFQVVELEAGGGGELSNALTLLIP